MAIPSLIAGSCSCCQSTDAHPSVRPGAGAHHSRRNTHFCIDLQTPGVRDHVLFMSIFPARHRALACIGRSVNEADGMHKVEDIDESALMALPQGRPSWRYSFTVHASGHAHAPRVGTPAFRQFPVHFNLRNVSGFLDPKIVNLVI